MKPQNNADFAAQRKFIKELGRSGLTAQQKRTLRGQVFAGDIEGAKKGLQRLMKAKQTREQRKAM